MESPRVEVDALVESARKGDRDAFDRLVLIFQDDLYNAARYLQGNREDAEDVTQEALLRAYRGIASFKGNSSFKTWLLRILINTSRSHTAHRRARKRSATVVSLSGGSSGEGSSMEVEVADEGAESSPEGRVLRRELQDAIHRAIAELDDASRAVLILRDIAGEAYSTIGEILEIPLGTVKSRVHRARLDVQERLRGMGLP